ncbi:sigma-70 family RNA polymerase sigma factor [bacterium]|nr:MAG: sigma-70 family RNA polymerase sigma factor [bacterium]
MRNDAFEGRRIDLRALRLRDSDAWALVVDRYQALVYSVARRYGLSAEDAGDVFSGTFRALLTSVDRLESVEALPRWLAVTAARESLRIKRISSRYVQTEDERMLDQIVDDEERDALASAAEAESSLALREGIARLADRCRDLLTALYLEDDPPYGEISERIGIPVGAIGPTRGRCLEKLKKILRDLPGFVSEGEERDS